jgi:hypothetical protein
LTNHFHRFIFLPAHESACHPSPTHDPRCFRRPDEACGGVADHWLDRVLRFIKLSLINPSSLQPAGFLFFARRCSPINVTAP